MIGSNTESFADDWPQNYFNYFTEIEEHFRKTRGTALFLLSPLDWALIENWKSAGVPLEAVIKGIDEAFEKWRSKKTKTHRVNSLAYCAQAVMQAASRLTGAGAVKARQASEPPFTPGEIREFLSSAAAKITETESPVLLPICSSLAALAADAELHVRNLEELERRLTALEDKMVALARGSLSAEELFEMRQRLDHELSHYRGKMTADQITMLERRYLDTQVLEKEKLPRLSLFYMR